MTDFLGNFCNDENGATAIEYALIAGLVSIGIVASLQNVTASLDAMFTKVTNAFS